MSLELLQGAFTAEKIQKLEDEIEKKTLKSIVEEARIEMEVWQIPFLKMKTGLEEKYRVSESDFYALGFVMTYKLIPEELRREMLSLEILNRVKTRMEKEVPPEDPNLMGRLRRFTGKVNTLVSGYGDYFYEAADEMGIHGSKFLLGSTLVIESFFERENPQA